MLVKLLSNIIVILLVTYGLCYAFDYPFGLKSFVGLYALSIFIRHTVTRPYPKEDQVFNIVNKYK